MATSVTVRAIGPTTSRCTSPGITPARLIRPIVGFRPTIDVTAAGKRIDERVSPPIEIMPRLAEIAAAGPLLEPLAKRSRSYGFLTPPPRPLKTPLQHAISSIFPFARMSAPASLSLRATVASCVGVASISQYEPLDV